jgi:putative peptidoglycan lipid II flippase
MIPAMLGAGINTINVFVGSTLASMLPGGSVTYLFYADRIMELPLGVFAIAIGTALLPSFSRHTAADDIDGLKSSISFALRLMLFLTIPSTFALMALNLPIISVLFQRGAFNMQAAVRTSEALLFYAMGLWAFSIVRVYVQSFYSLQDAKWPMRAALIAFVVNLIFSLLLMYPMKHKGLALANSLSAVFNVFILSFVLRKKIGKFLDRHFYIAVSKIIISSIMMVASIKLFDYFLPWNIDAAFKTKLIYLISSIIIGAGAFFASAYLMKSPEIHSMVNILKKRLNRS